jgi:dissimilatory sulfite reductase (desulfoviridin) alpha/beta subunit
MTIHRLALPESAYARLTDRQRAANIAEERAEHVQTARAIIRGQDRYSNDQLRDACSALQAWGDGFDHLTADAMIQALNRREWQARNLPQETPADVARGLAHRWPEVLGWGAVIAAGMLVGTGWW